MNRLVLVATFLFAACGGKSAPEMPPIEVFPAKDAPPITALKEIGAGPVMLTMRATPGDSDKGHATVTINGKAGGGGQSMDIDMTMSFGTSATISEVKPNGVFTMKTEMSDTNVKVGGALAAQLGDKVSMLGDHMNGITTAVQIDGKGRMVDIDIGGSNPLSAASMGLDNSFQSGFVPLPDEPVGVGGKWDSYGWIEAMGTKARMVASYTLVAMDGSVATIDMTLHAVGEPGSAKAPGSPIPMDIKTFDMSGGGRMKIDFARPTHGELHLELDANAAMTAQDQDATLDMHMKMESMPL